MFIHSVEVLIKTPHIAGLFSPEGFWQKISSKLPRQHINGEGNERVSGRQLEAESTDTKDWQEVTEKLTPALPVFCPTSVRVRASESDLTSFPNHTNPKYALLFAVFLFFYEKFCCMSFLCRDSFIVENKMEAVWDWKEMLFYLFIYLSAG